MIYKISIQIQGENYSLGSLESPAAAKEQGEVLKAYLERNSKTYSLFKEKIINNETLFCAIGKGFYTENNSCASGKPTPYKKIADWTPQETGARTTSVVDSKLSQVLLINKDIAIADIETRRKSIIPPQGIRNVGSNCFLNAALQFVIHSPLGKIFTEERPKNNCIRVAEFNDFFENYREGEVALDSERIRELFKYDKDVQNDSADFLRKLADSFSIEPTTEIKHFSKHDDSFSYSVEDQEWLHTLGFDAEDGSLKSAIDRYFSDSDDHENQAMSQKRILLESAKDLYFRLDWAEGESSAKKIGYLDIGKENSIDISGNKFSILGYVQHLGHTVDYGHYIYYLNLGDKCFCIDDKRVRQVTKREFLENAAKSYLLHLSR
ncbi:MAG: ubiquitin carboxyl-terminal hydrolase family protein (plasmid) [Candidatus Algichlamydia australiensis]|nr:ubiquitin carboxyl-terminal hydrolase family protein [Chlamydiales bacterium]